jgi:hypothetical protein
MKSLWIRLAFVLICSLIVSVACSSHRFNTTGQYDRDLDRLVKSWGDEWVLLNEPFNVDYYAHLKSMNHLPSGYSRVWMRTLFRTGDEYKAEKDPVDFYQTLQEFDCVNKRYRYIYSEGFDKIGTKIGSPWQDENSKWYYLKPDDDYRGVFTRLCK